MSGRISDDVLKNALIGQVKQIQNLSSKLLNHYSIECLHQLRVSVLRLIFALNFFKRLFDVENINDLTGKLRKIRHVMGKARDFDVVSLHIENDFRILKTRVSEKNRIRKAIKPLIHKNRQEVLVLLNSDFYNNIPAKAIDVLKQRNKRRIRPGIILNHLWKKVDRIRSAGSRQDFHKIRIYFKNLHYAYAILTDCYKESKFKKGLKAVINIQKVLGEYRDARNVIKVLKDLQKEGKLSDVHRFIGIESKQVIVFQKRFKRQCLCLRI